MDVHDACGWVQGVGKSVRLSCAFHVRAAWCFALFLALSSKYALEWVKNVFFFVAQVSSAMEGYFFCLLFLSFWCARGGNGVCFFFAFFCVCSTGR